MQKVRSSELLLVSLFLALFTRSSFFSIFPHGTLLYRSSLLLFRCFSPLFSLYSFLLPSFARHYSTSLFWFLSPFYFRCFFSKVLFFFVSFLIPWVPLFIPPFLSFLILSLAYIPLWPLYSLLIFSLLVFYFLLRLLPLLENQGIDPYPLNLANLRLPFWLLFL